MREALDSGKGPGKDRDRALLSVRRRLLLALLVLLVVLGVVLFWTRERQTRNAARKAPPPPPAIAVSAVKVQRADFLVSLTGLGTVTPVATVVVHTRVDGQLMEVRYKEGAMVREGDVLAVLDPRPFQATLTQAEGQLARDSAQLAEARIDLERYRALWAEDSIAKITFDTQASLVGQLEGAVKTDQGVIDTSRINLIYCRITSPITGRVGLQLVDPGNIVHTTDTNGIVVVAQMRPITVVFPISEDSVPQVRAKLKAGAKLVVEAYDRDMTQRLATGKLIALDNQIDVATGTLRLRAEFPNEKDTLFPNQFVNARLLVDTIKGAAVTPADAIQRGPQGTFVYVVNAEMTAAVRPVTVGAVQGGGAWIKTGLSPGELVVVSGVDKLRPGARVRLAPQAAAPAAQGQEFL